MKEILCFAKYAVKWRQAFNQRFLKRCQALNQRFLITAKLSTSEKQGRFFIDALRVFSFQKTTTLFFM